MANKEEGLGRAGMRRTNRLGVTAGVVVGLLVIGHLSNLFGLRRCEQGVLRRFVHAHTRGKPVRLSGWQATEFLTRRLRQIDAEYQVVSDEEAQENPYPWCDMKPAIPVCPFVVSVELHWLVGPLGGWGGRIYLLNFFGLNVPVWYQQDWVS